MRFAVYTISTSISKNIMNKISFSLPSTKVDKKEAKAGSRLLSLDKNY